MTELILNDPIDYEALKQLYCDQDDLNKAWPEAKFPFCQDQWSEWIDEGIKASSLLFLLNQKPIGHAVLRLSSQNQLYLCFVLLTKAHRGAGLIYEMLTRIEDFARANYSQDSIYLHVDPENLRALKVYQKLGYLPVLITEKDRLRMMKKIS